MRYKWTNNENMLMMLLVALLLQLQLWTMKMKMNSLARPVCLSCLIWYDVAARWFIVMSLSLVFRNRCVSNLQLNTEHWTEGNWLIEINYSSHLNWRRKLLGNDYCRVKCFQGTSNYHKNMSVFGLNNGNFINCEHESLCSAFGAARIGSLWCIWMVARCILRCAIYAIAWGRLSEPLTHWLWRALTNIKDGH